MKAKKGQNNHPWLVDLQEFGKVKGSSYIRFG